ncbi:MAG: hypothetical protein QM736_10075 [Vicinamibacterales bacterium]
MMKRHHLAIARHLGHDRRSRDGGAAAIAFDHASLRHRDIRNPERVDEHEIGKRRERHDRTTHRVQRRTVDVETVDSARRTRSHGPRQCAADDLGVQVIALVSRHDLRVGQPRDVSVGVEDDGAGSHRSGETAASYFVDPCDEAEADAPQRILDGARGGDAGHGEMTNAE